MDRLAESLDQAADSLKALSREIPGLAAAPGAFAVPPGALAVPPVASMIGAAGVEPVEQHGGTAGEPLLVTDGADRGGVRVAGSGRDAADAPGLPGRVGRALHGRWAAVLEARSHEASAAAARLTALADSVRATQRNYTETDQAVQRRFTREM